MAETELERAEKRFAQAKARLQALRNREATKQRKVDTRRKVILGGALVDLAGRDDRAAEMLERLVRNLVREQDRAAFAGWDWRAGARDGQAEGSVGSGDAEAESPGDGSVGISPDTDRNRVPENADAARNPEAKDTSTFRFIRPDNPNLYKEFLAERRARAAEE